MLVTSVSPQLVSFSGTTVSLSPIFRNTLPGVIGATEFFDQQPMAARILNTTNSRFRFTVIIIFLSVSFFFAAIMLLKRFLFFSRKEITNFEYLFYSVISWSITSHTDPSFRLQIYYNFSKTGHA